jgi:ubiquinone/menaquinone biosynthesis C-methylase UbiE
VVDLFEYHYCVIDDIIKQDIGYVVKAYKTDIDNSFHKQNEDENIEKKYGKDSIFSTIDKLSYPSFLLHYKKALQSVKIETRKNILNLGINRADEFEAIKALSDPHSFSSSKLLGIDYCDSAISHAKEVFKEDNNISFLQADIKKLSEYNIGRFDLIISIATLQSSNLEFNKIFMEIVQNHLQKDGAMILGFPNCRWVEDKMFYGARIKNYNYPELSNLYKDVVFCKKYLQQKKFRVTITGKDYIFLTATSIR